MKKVHINPSEEDLIISGEFLGIDVSIYAFTVRTVLYVANNIPSSFVEQNNVFPIRFMQEFFKANSNTPIESYFDRAPLLEPTVITAGVAVAR